MSVLEVLGVQILGAVYQSYLRSTTDCVYCGKRDM